MVDNIAPFLEDQNAKVGVDVVVLYTDGITEAANGGGEMFGEDRLRRAITRHAAAGVEDLVQRTLRDVRDHMVHQDDDITIIAMKRLA